MKRPISIILSLLAILIIAVTLSLLATLLLSSFWSWFEASTGIESMGHSGPADWCYLVTFLILVSIITATFIIYQRGKKGK